MINLSIIDIGSNTIHLLIVNIDNKDRLKVLFEDKEHLRLGEELALNKKISNAKITETLEILKKYISISSDFKANDIIAVATEALRIAENNLYILDLIKNNLGLHIKLLSSHEEAYLSFLGVKKTCNINNGIIIDSGGASTEIIGVKNNSFITSSSIHFGAINVTEKITMDSSGRFISCEYDTKYFSQVFSEIKWIQDFSNSPLIGVGGTFKNLRNIFNYSKGNNNNTAVTELSCDDLFFLCSSIKNLSLDDRKKLKGLASKRSDIILGGCEIITNIVKFFNITHILIAESGLRTGILFHYIDVVLNQTLPEDFSIMPDFTH